MHRRAFLSTTGLSMLAIGMMGSPLFLHRTALSAVHTLAQRRKVLVSIFQRGAMDGLMAVNPYTDEFIGKHRKRLAMTAPQKGVNNPDALLDLDGRFGLHPAMSALAPLFTEKHIAIIHACGSPDTTRSHFDAQDYMEIGMPGKKGRYDGWLNRVGKQLPQDKEHITPFRSVAMTPALPRSLSGDGQALAIANLRDFAVKSSAMSQPTSSAQGFEALYDATSERLLRDVGKEGLHAAQLLSQKIREGYKPSVEYPATPLANALKQVAQLIKYDVGLEIAFVEQGGWDTHVGQGAAKGAYANKAKELADAMAAFWNDIAPFHDDVTVMTMTEFGRTVRENGSGGTDHGRGSCMFALGTHLHGGMVHGHLPVLAPENLEDGRDVPVTTDFRAFFADIAGGHFGINKITDIFPEWNGRPTSVYKG
jgi:uncharacterized protein (DUF1501 family)